MYWLQPPDLRRRVAAVLLVIGAIVWDLRGAATMPVAVAARPIPAGSSIDGSSIEGIELPSGAIAAPVPIGATATTDIEAGDVLVASLLGNAIVAPEGWWTVPIAVGTLAVPGDEALLVVADPPVSVVGIVVKAQVGDPYDLDHRPAAVAVPPNAAPAIAAAEQEGLLVAAIRTSAGGQ